MRKTCARACIFELRHAKRVLRVILIKTLIFSIYWMYIILRLICEILSRIIAVKISFLYSRKHGVYVAASFAANVTSWYLRNGMPNFTSFIFYINIICISRWLFGANFQIYTVPVHLYDAKNFFSQKALSSKHVSIFLPRKDDVISQLYHSYPKDPLCVTWLIWLIIKILVSMKL